jgi:hypothetical protein
VRFRNFERQFQSGHARCQYLEIEKENKKAVWNFWARVPDSLRLLRGACARATLARLTLSLSPSLSPCLCVPLAEPGASACHLIPIGRRCCCQSTRSAYSLSSFFSFCKCTCTSATCRPSHVSPSPTLPLFPVFFPVQPQSTPDAADGADVASRVNGSRARVSHQTNTFAKKAQSDAKGGGASRSPFKPNMLS